MVVTLGSVQMKSKPRAKDSPALTELVSRGHSQEEVMDIVRSSSYDHFIIELTDIQVLHLCDYHGGCSCIGAA